MSAEAIERRSIIISIVASTSFGVLGIVISIGQSLWRSVPRWIVLFDIRDSWVADALRVSTRFPARATIRIHSGYATFEPMLNLLKGLLIGFALVYALWTAIRTILTGGQEIAAEGGILYAVIAVVGGAVVVFFLKRYAKQSGSPIVDVDAKNWTVDTLISSAVGVAFVVTLLIENSDWSDFAPYADPVIMLAIIAIASPQPFQTIRAQSAPTGWQGSTKGRSGKGLGTRRKKRLPMSRTTKPTCASSMSDATSTYTST